MRFELIASRSKKPNLLSKAIMKFMDCDYSHVAILVDGSFLYHATGKGFHEVYFQDFVKEKEVVKRIELNVVNDMYAFGWLDGCIGTEYSQIQYLGFLFPFLRNFLKNGRKKTICSEAVADFMMDCCEMELPFLTDFISPKEIVYIAELHGK